MHKTLFSIFLSMLLLSAGGSYGQDLDNIRKERQLLLKQIEQTNEALSANKKSVTAQLYQYNVLNDKIKADESYIQKLSSEVRNIERSIKKTNEECRLLEQQLTHKKNNYALSVYRLYLRMNTNDKLMFVFSAENLQQSYRRIRYLNEYSSYQREQADEIKKQQKELEIKQKELEESYAKESALLKERKSERDKLAKERQKQDVIIKNLRKKQRSLTAALKEQEQQADSLSRQIEKAIQEETKTNQQDKSRNPVKDGGYAMSVDEQKLAADFGKNKGQLIFPVSEPGTIVVHFGQQKYKDLPYVQGNSKGIEIQTMAGASARAIFSGTVTKIFMVPGMNFSVIVRHGNYLSVYSRLDNVRVKTGDKIKMGEKLGTIFVDEANGNLTLMHFQVWKDSQRLDPELWIKRF